MKRNFNGKLACVLFLAAFVFSSCRKDSFKGEDPVESARDWYTSASKGSKMKLHSSSGASAEVKQEALWNEAVMSKTENNEDVLRVPLTLKYANGELVKGNFSLMISKQNDSYKSKTVYDTTARISDSSFQNRALSPGSNIIIRDPGSAGQLKSNTGKGDLSKGDKQMVYYGGGDPDCVIDWYLTTIWFDYYGNILNISEQYMFSTPCGGPDGGGGGDPSEEFQRLKILEETAFEITGTDLSLAPTENTGDNTRTLPYSWELGRNNIANWSVRSHELGKHIREGGQWRWESLSHTNISVHNKPVWISVEIQENLAIPYVSTHFANMYVDCIVSSWAIFKNFPLGPPPSNLTKYSPAWQLPQ